MSGNFCKILEYLQFFIQNFYSNQNCNLHKIDVIIFLFQLKFGSDLCPYVVFGLAHV